ncbi:hypothetical protein KY285_001041 [Solanum tuberosum]|nr:hypothetical protein KY285_001041 [Solanum tuberosum]
MWWVMMNVDPVEWIVIVYDRIGAWKAPPPLEIPRGLCLSRVSKRLCSREASRPVKGLHCPYNSLVAFVLANFGERSVNVTVQGPWRTPLHVGYLTWGLP